MEQENKTTEELKLSTQPQIGMTAEQVKTMLEVDNKGNPYNTIANYLIILRNDSKFSKLHYDTMREAPIIVNNLHHRELWTDKDNSKMRLYLETTYHLNGREKLSDAFNVLCDERHYSPVQEIIKSEKWDGIPRCETFFQKWANSPDDEYTRECGRLFFAEGISRAFNYGSQCDYVIVLRGDQGIAKSTLSKWLAIENDFYISLTAIKGKDARQELCGKWIVELEELLATTADNTTAEETKQFISNQIDTFRPPYGRNPIDHKRSCIFIGTTNKPKFLSDPTGNRRWYPLENRQNAEYLFSHQQECKKDIIQCWAEMYQLWKTGSEKAATYTNNKLIYLVKQRQCAAEEDDPEIGIIEEYLKHKEKVCLAEICDNALKIDWQKLNQKQRNSISAKLTGSKIGCIIKMTQTSMKPSQDRFGKYGMQQAYIVPERLYHYKGEDND